MVRRPCEVPSCLACRMGPQDFCQTGQFRERGIKELHGFMVEQVVEREHYLHVVPESLADVGVLVEPLTIAEKALLEVVNVQDRLPWLAEGLRQGATAVVLGAGPVGLLGCLALVLRGFRTFVYSLEDSESLKAQWVRSIGAQYLSARDLGPAGPCPLTVRIHVVDVQAHRLRVGPAERAR